MAVDILVGFRLQSTSKGHEDHLDEKMTLMPE